MPRGSGDSVVDDNDQPVRIALSASDESARVSGSGAWRVYSRNSSNLVVKGSSEQSMKIEPRGGQLVVTPNNGGLLVVNRLGVESYLRGVVPLEIGDRKPGEEAAVEAQAVAARSYTYIHMSEAGNRAFDMYGSIQDQAYGGVDAEKVM